MIPKLSTSALALALAVAPPGAGSREPTLAEVRAATARFQDVRQAIAEGYVRDPENMCVTAEMMGEPAGAGAMGVHFFRPDLLGISGPPSPRVNGSGTHTDFTKPGILIYEPQPDGSLQLVAVENLVFQWSWRQAGNSAPPSFHGVRYQAMQDDPRTKVDEAHMFEPHYDLHLWLFRDNPNGQFAPYNPNVSCAAMERSAGAAHGDDHSGER